MSCFCFFFNFSLIVNRLQWRYPKAFAQVRSLGLAFDVTAVSPRHIRVKMIHQRPGVSRDPNPRSLEPRRFWTAPPRTLPAAPVSRAATASAFSISNSDYFHPVSVKSWNSDSCKGCNEFATALSGAESPAGFDADRHGVQTCLTVAVESIEFKKFHSFRTVTGLYGSDGDEWQAPRMLRVQAEG